MSTITIPDIIALVAKAYHVKPDWFTSTTGSAERQQVPPAAFAVAALLMQTHTSENRKRTGLALGRDYASASFYSRRYEARAEWLLERSQETRDLVERVAGQIRALKERRERAAARAVDAEGACA